MSNSKDANEPVVNPPMAGTVTRLSARYADAFPLRSAIQAIPVLGGSLDTMLAGLGAKWQYERLERFLSSLSNRIRMIEGHESLPEIEPSEPLYDFIMRVFDHVIRNRSDHKREAFATIAARQIIERGAWDEAEAAVRLVADLSDLHVEILTVAATIPIDESSFKGLRVVTLPPATFGGVSLIELFPGVNERALRLVCSELVARGLFYDEGIGRMGVGAMEYFVATDLGHWFLEWLRDSRRCR